MKQIADSPKVRFYHVLEKSFIFNDNFIPTLSKIYNDKLSEGEFNKISEFVTSLSNFQLNLIDSTSAEVQSEFQKLLSEAFKVSINKKYIAMKMAIAYFIISNNFNEILKVELRSHLKLDKKIEALKELEVLTKDKNEKQIQYIQKNYGNELESWLQSQWLQPKYTRSEIIEKQLKKIQEKYKDKIESWLLNKNMMRPVEVTVFSIVLSSDEVRVKNFIKRLADQKESMSYLLLLLKKGDGNYLKERIYYIEPNSTKINMEIDESSLINPDFFMDKQEDILEEFKSNYTINQENYECLPLKEGMLFSWIDGKKDAASQIVGYLKTEQHIRNKRNAKGNEDELEMLELFEALQRDDIGQFEERFGNSENVDVNQSGKNVNTASEKGKGHDWGVIMGQRHKRSKSTSDINEPKEEASKDRGTSCESTVDALPQEKSNLSHQ